MRNTALFVYGTLMKESVQLEIIGRVCQYKPAKMAGYSVHVGLWPYLIEQSGSEVSGMVLEGLTDTDFVNLDAYERITTIPNLPDNEMYARRLADVTHADGTHSQAWVYFPLLHKWWPEWLKKNL
ncbi:MAG: gamma-glutamylcyclotransferase [Alphaproteobacteria bacterium]|nr:gamma-glutamylcyclotransferase [Alphaproteobacteria bacterium]MBV8548789.1 gamma-glutamylcyclotransferase [Alphaproteobacteria bacterium]